MKYLKYIILYIAMPIYLLLSFNNFNIAEITLSSLLFLLLIIILFTLPLLYIYKSILPYIHNFKNVYMQNSLKILLASLFSLYLTTSEHILIIAFPNEISCENTTHYLIFLVLSVMLFLYESPKTDKKKAE
jgi:hypothetical protein